MSYTTMFKVPASGEVETFREFSNSHRGASLLWDYLGHKHVPGFRGMYGDDDSEKVWKLASDESVPEHERIVLLTTFDNVLLWRGHFERVAAAMDRVGAEMMRITSDGFHERDGGHYPAMAAALREMLADPEAFAACWQQTSVAEDQWIRYDTCPACGQDLEESRGFDLSKDTGHWFMLEDPQEVDAAREGVAP